MFCSTDQFPVCRFPSHLLESAEDRVIVRILVMKPISGIPRYAIVRCLWPIGEVMNPNESNPNLDAAVLQRSLRPVN